MSIFVSEPARPGPQRLPEVLRKRRVTGVEASRATAASGADPETGATPALRPKQQEQQLARRAALGYQQEAADTLSPELPYLPVSQLISPGVVSVDSSLSLEQARATMTQHGISHLVVLHEDQVAGLIDLTWVLQRQLVNNARTETGVLLANETLPSFITATPETDCHELARQMLGYQLDCALILDQHNQITAVATATDFLRLYCQQNSVHESI